MLGKRLINTGGVGACTTDTVQILDAGSTASLALYRFEDNANDTASSTGKFGKGAVFNGSNSQITLPAALSDGSTTDTNCISFWFNVGAEVTSSSSNNEIMSFSKSGSNTGKIALGSTTGNFSNETFSVTSDVANQYTYITETIPAGWNHAVVQWNSSTTRWDIYINGQAKSTSTFGTNEQGKLLLKFGNRSSYYFDGKLDQVRVFNRSLNQNEITTLYNETSSTVNTLQILGDTSCIATYTFEGNSQDLSTNYYHGSASNVIYDYSGTESNITYVTGKFGKAASFNGSSSRVILPSGEPFGDSDTIKCISAWIKPNSTSTRMHVFSVSGNDAYDYFRAVYDGNNSVISTFSRRNDSNNSSYQYASITPDTNWHHVVFQLGSSGVEIYLDNTKLTLSSTTYGTGTNSSWISYPNYAGTIVTQIGKSRQVTPQWSDGLQDQTRLFDRALSASEINSLYNETATSAASATIDNPSTLAYYKMADATDETGNYDGTPTSVDFNVEGKYGFAGKFNGSNSKIALNKTPFISLKNNFSYSLWFKSYVTTQNQTIFSHLGNNTPKYGVFLNHQSDSSQSIRFFYSKGSNSQGNQSSSTNIWNVGQWHHLVITKSSTDGLKGYLDNTQIITDATLTDDLTPYTAQNGNSNIGIYQYQTSGGELYPFNGKIDQVRIFNKAISASEVTKLYNEIQCANTIAAPENYFNTKLYTGDGGTQPITGVGFPPDMTWIKARSVGYSHSLQDTLRGPGTSTSIYPDLNSAEGTYGSYGQISAFGTSGFTVASGGHSTYPTAQVNQSNVTYASWNWKAGGILNQSAFFNGSNSYISTGYTAATGSAASISLWVSIAAYTSYGGFAIDSTGTGAEVRFTLGQGNAAGKLWVSVGNGSTSWYDETTVSISSYGLNKWFHLVGTVDGTSVKIYINGSLIHTFTSSISYVGGGQHNYYLGGWGSQLILNGHMDQVRFFNKAISDSDVTTLYNETSSTINTLQVLGDTSCVAAFPLGANANDLNTNNTSSSAANVTFNNPGHLHRNNNGTIGSTVSASQESGFSIVKYTGNGTAGSTVGHGLNTIPSLVIWKNLDATSNWLVYSPLIGNDSQWLYLNLGSSAQTSSSTNEYPTNKVDPTSSVVTVNGSGSSNNININGEKTIMYCFANIDGYQRIGSYVGTGTRENFIYTGFEAAWVLIKNISTGAKNWVIVDNKRDNADEWLYADEHLIAYDDANTYTKFYANGFSVANNGSYVNTSGDTYLFLAIAANPDTTEPTKANSFKTKIYTGSASPHTITGLGFKPDFIWTKNRDQPDHHALVDSVRGIVNPAPYLATNRTDIQSTSASMPTSVQDNGYTVTGTGGRTNTIGEGYVSWNWKAGDHDRNLASINNDGSIKSIVSANKKAGFSIVKYRGTGLNNETVGHGLGVAPDMVIVKDLDNTNYWCVGGSAVGNGQNLYLNDYGQRQTRDRVKSVQTNTFTLGSHFETNASYEFIAYCFASKDDYSRISTYPGSGNSQTIYVTDNDLSTGSGGFQPSWIIIKNMSLGNSNWMIYDAVRDTDGTLSEYLVAHSYSIESTATTATITPISNGFTIGNTNSRHVNDSTSTYIYMAIK